MRLPSPLRKLDDRVLGDRLRGRSKDADSTQVVERPPTRDRPPLPQSTGKGARQAVDVFYKVCRLVFLLLALTVALGIVFTLTPTNEDNVIVRNVLDLAEGAAGPFKDVFTVDDDAERELIVNYALAGFVYLLAAGLVTKLPGGKR